MKCQASGLRKRTIIDAARRGCAMAPFGHVSPGVLLRLCQNSCARWRSTRVRKMMSSTRHNGRSPRNLNLRGNRKGIMTPFRSILGRGTTSTSGETMPVAHTGRSRRWQPLEGGRNPEGNGTGRRPPTPGNPPPDLETLRPELSQARLITGIHQSHTLSSTSSGEGTPPKSAPPSTSAR